MNWTKRWCVFQPKLFTVVTKKSPPKKTKHKNTIFSIIEKDTAIVYTSDINIEFGFIFNRKIPIFPIKNETNLNVPV